MSIETNLKQHLYVHFWFFGIVIFKWFLSSFFFSSNKTIWRWRKVIEQNRQKKKERKKHSIFFFQKVKVLIESWLNCFINFIRSVYVNESIDFCLRRMNKLREHKIRRLLCYFHQCWNGFFFCQIFELKLMRIITTKKTPKRILSKIH